MVGMALWEALIPLGGASAAPAASFLLPVLPFSFPPFAKHPSQDPSPPRFPPFQLSSFPTDFSFLPFLQSSSPPLYLFPYSPFPSSSSSPFLLRLLYLRFLRMGKPLRMQISHPMLGVVHPLPLSRMDMCSPYIALGTIDSQAVNVALLAQWLKSQLITLFPS